MKNGDSHLLISSSSLSPLFSPFFPPNNAKKQFSIIYMYTSLISFYVFEADLDKNKAEVSHKKLTELN
jgi:hypothetical protein